MAPSTPTFLEALHPARLRARWERRPFNLDPGQLSDPIDEPTPDSFIITGCPRTGTSLAAAVMFQPPRVVTLVEPWDGMRLAPRELFSHWRGRIRSERSVNGGTLDFAALADGQVKRVPEGSSNVSVEVEANFQLGIKWPSFFAYLGRLPTTRFVVCVRHPFEVVGSMMRLRGSNVQRGLDYDIPFNQGMNRTLRDRTTDPALRRIEMFDFISERLSRHIGQPNVFELRYERWAQDPERLIEELSDFLGTSLDEIPVTIRSGSGAAPVDEQTRALVRRHSRMAHRLGYDLN